MPAPRAPDPSRGPVGAPGFPSDPGLVAIPYGAPPVPTAAVAAGLGAALSASRACESPAWGVPLGARVAAQDASFPPRDASAPDPPLGDAGGFEGWARARRATLMAL